MAITLPVLLGAVGFSVEYSIATGDAVKLQAAADAAALALVVMPGSSTDAQLMDKAEKLMNANFPAQDRTLTIKRSKGMITIEAVKRQKTAFLSAFHLEEFVIRRKATAVATGGKFEIVMALDTTASMSGNKIKNLKIAAKQLVDNVATQSANAANIKIGLVPFASIVNVGEGYGPLLSNGVITRPSAEWLDYRGNSPISQSDFEAGVSRFAFFHHLGDEWKGCVETRPTSHGVDLQTTDDPPDQSRPETLFVPAFSSDEPSGSDYMNDYVKDGVAGITESTAAKRLKRYGADYSVKPSTLAEWAASEKGWKAVKQDNSASEYYSNNSNPKGPNFSCVTRPIVPLTTDHASIKAQIDALTLGGNTNIPEGIAWGWRALSPGTPFTEGASYSDQTVQKVLIVLTDGSNVMGTTDSDLGSAYGAFGYFVDGRLTTDKDYTKQAMDAKVQKICSNAKDAGIELYTILLEEEDQKTSDILKQCATDLDHYTKLSDNSQLTALFSDIYNDIIAPRLIE